MVANISQAKKFSGAMAAVGLLASGVSALGILTFCEACGDSLVLRPWVVMLAISAISFLFVLPLINKKVDTRLLWGGGYFWLACLSSGCCIVIAEFRCNVLCALLNVLVRSSLDLSE